MTNGPGVDPEKITVAKLQFSRGWSDAYAGHSPASLMKHYVEGYAQGRKASEDERRPNTPEDLECRWSQWEKLWLKMHY